MGFAVSAPDADHNDFHLPQENLPATGDVGATDYSLQAGKNFVPLYLLEVGLFWNR